MPGTRICQRCTHSWIIKKAFDMTCPSCGSVYWPYPRRIVKGKPFDRGKILKKYKYKCVQCSATERLEIDHIIPQCAGGADTEDNLQVLCKKCNMKKGGRMEGKII